MAKHFTEKNRNNLNPAPNKKNRLSRSGFCILKYSANFYLGMGTKQIANVLNVEPKSVRMTKYRLRQKFDLETGTGLIGYLKSYGVGG